MKKDNQAFDSEARGESSFASALLSGFTALRYAILMLYYVTYRVLNDINKIPSDEKKHTIERYQELFGEEEGYQLAKIEINGHIDWWADFYYLSQSAIAVILCLFLLHDGYKYVNKFKPKQKLVNGFGLAIVFFCSIYCGFEFYTELIGRYDRIIDSNLLIGMISGFLLFLLTSILSEMTDNSAQRNWQIVKYRIGIFIKKSTHEEKR